MTRRALAYMDASWEVTLADRPLAGAKVSASAQRLVLVCMAGYADPSDGATHVSLARLSHDTGLSYRGVRRAVAVLVEVGVINRVSRRRRQGGELSSWVHDLAPILALASSPPVTTSAGPPVTTSGRRTGHGDLTEVVLEVGSEVPDGTSVRPPVTTSPSASHARQPDEIWDVLVDLYGEPPPAPHPDRGRRNRAVKLARLADAEPEELRRLHGWAARHRDDSIRRRASSGVISFATNLPDLRRLWGDETSQATNVADLPAYMRPLDEWTPA